MRQKQIISDITGMVLTIFVLEAKQNSDITGMVLTIFVHEAKKQMRSLEKCHKVFFPGHKVFFPREKNFAKFFSQGKGFFG